MHRPINRCTTHVLQSPSTEIIYGQFRQFFRYVPIDNTPRNPPTLSQRLGVRIGPLVLTLLLKSLRIENGFTPSRVSPMIVVFWHGGMLVPWYVHRGGKAAALVSASRDGDILAALLDRWGIRVVRGSSSSGGSEAVTVMVDLIREGYTILITPDGPRGPVREMKIGALVVAQRTGAPIVMCKPVYARARTLHSWDAFQVPMPFSRVKLKWNAPASIGRECVGSALDDLRLRFQNDLRAIDDEDDDHAE